MAATYTHRRHTALQLRLRRVWVPAFAGTTVLKRSSQ